MVKIRFFYIVSKKKKIWKAYISTVPNIVLMEIPEAKKLPNSGEVLHRPIRRHQDNQWTGWGVDDELAFTLLTEWKGICKLRRVPILPIILLIIIFRFCWCCYYYFFFSFDVWFVRNWILYFSIYNVFNLITRIMSLKI